MSDYLSSKKEIQKDELEAIKAIFMNEFTKIDPPPNSWKVPTPRFTIPHFILTLGPYHTENASKLKKEVSVDLEIKFSSRYPDTPPELLCLKNPKGIPLDMLPKLNASLQTKAKALVGKEMVYELACEVQESLSSYLSSIHTSDPVPSMTSSYEQMKSRQAIELKLKAKQEEEKKVEEEKQLELAMKQKSEMLNKHIESEFQRKEKLKEQHRERRKLDLPFWFQLVWPPLLGTKFNLQRPVAHFPDDPDSPLFQSLLIIKKLIYPSYLMLLCSECSSELLVSILILKTSRTVASTLIHRLKKFAITSSMSTLHPNIFRIYDFLWDTESKVSSLLILEEGTFEYDLERFLKLFYKLEIRIACGYMYQLLNALNHLHEFTFHGSLDLNQVFLCQNGVLKLSCLSIFIPDYQVMWPETWKPTQTTDKSLDVYYSACIFLILICGSKLLTWYTPSSLIELWHYSASSFSTINTTPTALEAKEMRNILTKLPKNLKETLISMLTFQPLQTSNLCYFFLSLSNRIQSLSTSLSLLPSETPILLSPSQQGLLGVSQSTTSATMNSRYATDFEELEPIGRGGFGQVVKAKNKLDGRTYAIKKVKLSKVVYDNRRILREVRAISRLNSIYCVRYFQAWVETAQGLSIEDDDDDDEEEETSEYSSDSSSSSSSESHSTFSTTSSSLNSSRNPSPLHSSPSSSYQKHMLSPSGSTQHLKGILTPSSSPLAEMDASSTISITDLEVSKQTTSSNDLPKKLEDLKTASTPKILYIQMELCENRTLSDVIDRGLPPLSETWRLFRQILEGLVHIHAIGMIHRDLKPKNIFLDAKNNVKIGDFGLATTFFHSSELNGVASRSDDINRSLTTDIGTATYTAPEVTSLSIKYNQKVDMYSLGIILFELTSSFSTGMERAMALRDLRSPQIMFPSTYPDSDTKKIIQWLLQHDPALRPTSLELLQSKWLPTTIEDKYIQEALRTVTNPENTSYYTKLLDLLFSQMVDPFKSFTYDDPTKHAPANLAAITETCSLLTRLFQFHGAISFQAPLVVPKDTFFIPKHHAQFLDPHGNFVYLPSDTMISFARYIARNSISQFKRYTISPIHKENSLGGQPLMGLETSFDIIAPSSSSEDGLAPVLELLQCSFQILEMTVPMHQRDYFIILNHLSITEAIFRLARLTAQQKTRVIEALESLMYKANPIHELRTKLLDFLPKKSVDLITSFLKLETDLTPITSRLPDLSPSSIEMLKKLTHGLTCLGLSCPIYFCPLFTLHYAYYRNHFVFQVRLTNAANKIEVLASGGRYDSLITEFIHPSLRTPRGFTPMAIGARLNMKKLVHVPPTFSSPSKPMNGVLVLVASFISGLILERMKMAKELWQAGIACELVYEEHPSFDKWVHYCKQFQIPYILFVKHETTGTVKLRSLRARTETELLRTDVVHYLSSELESEETHPWVAPTATLAMSTSNSVTPVAHHTTPSNRVLQWVSLPKSKKLKPKQVAMHLDKASLSVNKLLSELSKCPVLAIPLLSLSLLSAIASDFKEKRQGLAESLSASFSEKEMVEQVRTSLVKLKTQNHKYCFLYSITQDTQVFVNLT